MPERIPRDGFARFRNGVSTSKASLAWDAHPKSTTTEATARRIRLKAIRERAQSRGARSQRRSQPAATGKRYRLARWILHDLAGHHRQRHAGWPPDCSPTGAEIAPCRSSSQEMSSAVRASISSAVNTGMPGVSSLTPTKGRLPLTEDYDLRSIGVANASFITSCCSAAQL